jgi:hypothetical protein
VSHLCLSLLCVWLEVLRTIWKIDNTDVKQFTGLRVCLVGGAFAQYDKLATQRCQTVHWITRLLCRNKPLVGEKLATQRLFRYLNISLKECFSFSKYFFTDWFIHYNTKELLSSCLSINPSPSSHTNVTDVNFHSSLLLGSLKSPKTRVPMRRLQRKLFKVF